MAPTRPGPWSEDRLAAAFAARASTVPTPPDLVQLGISRVRAAEPPEPGWRRLLPAAAVVLALGVVAGGIVISNGGRGSGQFRAGPSPDLRTLDNDEFAFDYPAAWLAYEAPAAGSGFSSVAVLGTQPVERRCGNERRVDLNCVYEQRLEAGQVRLFVLTGGYRGQTIEDRLPVENGTTSRLLVAGMPAIVDEFDPRPDSYYGEDLLIRWEIARPGTGGTNVVRLEAMLKEPGVTEGRRQLDALVASFRFAAGPEPTASANRRPTASPVPSAAGEPPAEVLGLPVLSVEQAIAIRDSGRDDREIAVRGWFSPIGPVPCPAPATWPVSPLEPNCPDQWVVLMADPESLVTASATGWAGRDPLGPSIQIDLDDLDRAWQPPLPTLGPAKAVEIVAIGHFDDRRSFACPAPTFDLCVDRFAVDRVDRVGGQTMPTSVSMQAEGVISTSDAIVASVRSAYPDETVLSVAVVDGATGIGRIEPSLGTGVGGFIDEKAVWVVRTLRDDLAVTYLVVDGDDRLFEMDGAGRPVLVASPVEPSPPAGSTVVFLMRKRAPGPRRRRGRPPSSAGHGPGAPSRAAASSCPST